MVVTSAELRSVMNRSKPPEARHEFVVSIADDFTNRRRSALQLVYLSGYFEQPHAITGEELAETTGVSRATFRQHLYATERKLISRFLNNNPYQSDGSGFLTVVQRLPPPVRRLQHPWRPAG